LYHTEPASLEQKVFDLFSEVIKDKVLSLSKTLEDLD
jgi:hypothetical protein